MESIIEDVAIWYKVSEEEKMGDTSLTEDVDVVDANTYIFDVKFCCESRDDVYMVPLTNHESEEEVFEEVEE